MELDTVFVLVLSHGHYDEYRTKNIAAYPSRIDAEAEAECLRDLLRIGCPHPGSQLPDWDSSEQYDEPSDEEWEASEAAELLVHRWYEATFGCSKYDDEPRWHVEELELNPVTKRGA